MVHHLIMISFLKALLTQAICWLFTATVASLKNTYKLVTAGPCCFLQNWTSTTTRNHSLSLSSHRDAISKAPSLRIAPDMPSKEVRWPLWLTLHLLSVRWQPLTPCWTSQIAAPVQDSFSHFTIPEAWHSHLDVQSLSVATSPTWKHIWCITLISFLFQVYECHLYTAIL